MTFVENRFRANLCNVDGDVRCEEDTVFVNHFHTILFVFLINLFVAIRLCTKSITRQNLYVLEDAFCVLAKR